ncbi:oxygenase MpaB family protein [Pigmentiphaga litoralis]|uniref:oxygenase MpaB family protein n=1 Tax=Pigmentiphaga litoralis TaxID=516702 RepID=UPI003B42D9DE
MLPIPRFVRQRVESLAAHLLQPSDGPRVDFSLPAGEPALVAPDSVSWQVFKNPATLFIGGVAAVILELAEPRVRTGVWEHTSFRQQPMARLQRTGLAAMMTVYGARKQTEAMIAHVVRLHGAVQGITPGGTPYRATDTDLLDWVQATASFGFLNAYHVYARSLTPEDRDRFYAEGAAAARLYGAQGAPVSEADQQAQFAAMQPRLEASDIVHEFLTIIAHVPVLPARLRGLQSVMVRAAIDLVPAPVRHTLQLGSRAGLRPGERWLVTRIAKAADRFPLRSSPAVQACRRLGLPDDYLYRRRPQQR